MFFTEFSIMFCGNTDLKSYSTQNTKQNLYFTLSDWEKQVILLCFRGIYISKVKETILIWLCWEQKD